MKITIKNLTSGSPLAIAKANRLDYYGDGSFVPHGGVFYETSNWEKYGYADCVRVSEAAGTLRVESGTINKPSESEDLLSALNCCGFEFDDENSNMVRQSGQAPINLTPQVEIESVLAYSGCEVDQTETFEERENGFDETAICRAVKQKLLAIVPPDPMPTFADLRALLISLKSDIGDDYRADDDSDYPSMSVTIGADGKGGWSYQTGDNSYTGGAYGYPHWAVITLDRRSNCADLAHDVLDQLADLVS